MDEGREARLGPFQLVRCHGDLGHGLGLLYEARHVDTGAASLLLLPGDAVEWQPQGPWQVRLSYHPQFPAVRMEMEQTPAPANLDELANLFVLATAVFNTVGNDPRIQAHLAQASSAPSPRRAGRLGALARSGWAIAVAGLAVFALGLDLGWHLSVPSERQALLSPDVLSETLSQTPLDSLVDTHPPESATLTFPLPPKPFINQAAAPCYPELDEVEINGGCWVELGRRPPCLPKIQAEYQGKCYMGVTKERIPPKRQSQQP